MTDVKKVPEALSDLGKLYEERNELYKDNYKHFGKVMMGLFPNGLKLESPEEFCRFGLFVHVMTKATRYSNQFKEGGHIDSLDDITVYAQMLQEVDADIRNSSHQKVKIEIGVVDSLFVTRSAYAPPINPSPGDDDYSGR